jgi:hypothetical protein
VAGLLAPPRALDRVVPLEAGLDAYRRRWRERVDGMAVAA